MSQWGGYLDSATQLRCWMGALEGDVSAPLPPQPGPREKASQLDRLRALRADLEDHQGALSSLEEKARELYKKTGDCGFSHASRTQLQGQFDELTALVEVCSFAFIQIPVSKAAAIGGRGCVSAVAVCTLCDPLLVPVLLCV